MIRLTENSPRDIPQRVAQKLKLTQHLRCLFALMNWMIVLLSTACSSLPDAALDPPLTETLKQRITKARNAIIETRRTLARASGSAYVQELKIRLGELLSDEARAHYQVARAREGATDQALQVPQVKTLKQQAITLYREFLQEYQSSPLRARALFNLGQELRELGEYDEMRKAFEQLVDERPKDPLTMEALLVLGSDYFDRNQLDEAAQRLIKITEGPLHKVTGQAHYKLAWVRFNQDRCGDAITSFESAIKVSESWLAQSEERRARFEGTEFDVRREALVDLTFCYSKDRPERGAVTHLSQLAYDRGPLVAALEKLSRRYVILERNEGLRDTARALLDLGPDTPKRREDVENLHSALKKLKDYTRVGEDVARFTKTFSRVMSTGGLSSAQRASILIRFELLTRDLATSAQLELEHRFGKKKLPPQESAVLQLQSAYERYLETFGSRSSVRHLVNSATLTLSAQAAEEPKSGEDEPSKDKSSAEEFDLKQSELDILSNLSGIYSTSGRDYLAGQRYYERAQLLGNEGGEDAYQAVLHFQRALSTGERSRKELVTARASLRNAAAQLLQARLSAEQGPKVRYAIALTFYEEGRLSLAIEYLTAVAIEYPATEQGNLATLLVLDAYKQLSDFSGLAAAAELFIRLGVSQELKPRLTQLVAHAQQLALDELALEAAGVDGGDVSAELVDFAKSSSGSLGERALINAFVAAQSAGDFSAMREVAKLIENQYPKSAQLLGVFTGLARSATTYLYVDEAIDYYQKAIQVAPAQRAQLLAASAELSAMLGDVDGAIKALKQAVTDESSDDRIFALYLKLLIDHLQPEEAWTALEPLKNRGSVVIAAGLGYLQVLRRQFDEAEETLEPVIEAGDELDPYANALGLYALAEVNTQFLRAFTPDGTMDELGEWVTLMEMAEQSYLRVVRTGQPKWGAAALNRLAALSEYTGESILKFKPPSELSSGDQKRFSESFKQRASILNNQKRQSLKACRELGLLRGIVSSPVRDCLNDRLMSGPAIPPTQIASRQTRAQETVGGADREAFGRNPSDVKAAFRLAQALLSAGDPHLARLALAQALQGGGAEVHNLYGVACAQAGDFEGAMRGFGRAAISGLSAGIENAVKLLKDKLGVPEARVLTQEAWKVTTSGGQLW